MKRYQPSTPRAALGLTAVALAALTLGAMVVLPAKLEFAATEPDVCTTSASPIATD